MPRSSATTRFSPHPAASSLYFDGSGDVVNMGEVFAKERTDAFSISAWCWLGAFNATGSVVAAKYSNATARGYFWGISATTGKMRFFMRNTTTTNEISVNTDNIFPRRQWVHCVVTYDGSSTAAGVKMYWNGVEQTITTLVDNLSATTVDGAAFCIGAFDPTVQPWVGLLTDVRLHNVALSLAQINDLYLKNNAVSVEAYWPFTDGSGATLTETVAAVNGTITGAAWKTGVPGIFLVGSGRPTASAARTAASARIGVGLNTPAEIGDLFAWYKAETLAATLSNNDSLVTWEDSSCCGRTLAQKSGLLATPTFQTNVLNGYPVVRFSGSTPQGLASASFTGIVQPQTIFIVLKSSFQDTGTGQAIIDGSTNETFLTYFDASFGPLSRLSVYVGSGGALGEVSDIRDNFSIMGAVFNAGSSSFELDGNITNGSMGAGVIVERLNVGVTESGGAPFFGDIAEIIMYRCALSTADRTLIRNYLSRKYQISIA